MTRPVYFALGVAVLFALWVWPLPQLGGPPFSVHMAMHMALVTVAAPLLSLGVAGGRLDPVLRAPSWFAAVPASMLELVAVWAWHVPALHHAARTHPAAYALEQVTFLVAGVFLWASALGGGPNLRRARLTGGVTGLLLTAMHMTLLGALLALAPRVLYAHGDGGAHGHGGAPLLTPLLDQQLGGAIMLLVGGVAYLTGGLALVADALRHRRAGEGAA